MKTLLEANNILNIVIDFLNSSKDSVKKKMNPSDEEKIYILEVLFLIMLKI